MDPASEALSPWHTHRLPISIEIVGSRLSTTGVVDARTYLLALAARRPSQLGILTAYFAPETFTLLDDVVSAGAAAVEVVLAANSASRASWEAARDYANPSVQVRVARPSPGGILHPKLIVAESGSERAAIVGSSNFTSGGLWGNVELNVSLVETPPLAPASAVTVLQRVFADAFATATAPSRALWNRLVAAAPVRIPTRGRDGLSRRLSKALSELPRIGTALASAGSPSPARPSRARKRAPRMPRTRPTPGAPGTYNTLLFQLSSADVNRPTWQPGGRGTAQMNLPREALAPLGLTAAYAGAILVEAVGVGAYAGVTEVITRRVCGSVLPEDRAGYPKRHASRSRGG